MPIPNEGLGLALGGYLNNSLYMIAGFADDGGAIHQEPGFGSNRRLTMGFWTAGKTGILSYDK